jgi:hypothetical protein
MKRVLCQTSQRCKIMNREVLDQAQPADTGSSVSWMIALNEGRRLNAALDACVGDVAGLVLRLSARRRFQRRS